jgi:hypothetical protein
MRYAVQPFLCTWMYGMPRAQDVQERRTWTCGSKIVPSFSTLPPPMAVVCRGRKDDSHGCVSAAESMDAESG